VEPIQNFLHPLVAELVKKAPLSAEKVECAWRLAVGAGLARVTRVAIGDTGVIDVHVDDARWRDELERSRGVIVERLRAALGNETARVMRLHGPRAARRRGAGTLHPPSPPDRPAS